MFDDRVILPQHLPIPEKSRRSTDVCCTIIAAVFSLSMFIIACCMFNKSNLDRTFAPTNQNGKICSYDFQDKKYLNFPYPDKIQIRFCVQSCPEQTYPQQSPSGAFCLPVDQQARRIILQNEKVGRAWDYYNMKNSLIYTIFISIFIGLLWMVIVQFRPRLAPMIAAIGSIFFLIVIIFVLIFDRDNFWNNHLVIRIYAILLCLAFAIIFLVMLLFYRKMMAFQGLFLQYASRFLSTSIAVFAYIPLFLLFTAGLFALIIWQHYCFGTSSIERTQGQLYYQMTFSFWNFLNILEFIWGLQFLRDSFNFCVSGNAITWYWVIKDMKNSCFTPYQKLITKHWGSVVGGSFINAFLQYPTYFIELLVCHPEAGCTMAGKFCYNTIRPLLCLFDMVRADAYSYIYLSGIPFCNAARQCNKICDRSRHFVGNHSPMKHYKLLALTCCQMVSFFICYWILKYKTWSFDFWAVVLLALLAYTCPMLFVDIHADAAEGLQTGFLIEHQLQGQYPYMKKIIPVILVFYIVLQKIIATLCKLALNRWKLLIVKINFKYKDNLAKFTKTFNIKQLKLNVDEIIIHILSVRFNQRKFIQLSEFSVYVKFSIYYFNFFLFCLLASVGLAYIFIKFLEFWALDQALVTTMAFQMLQNVALPQIFIMEVAIFHQPSSQRNHRSPAKAKQITKPLRICLQEIFPQQLNKKKNMSNQFIMYKIIFLSIYYDQKIFCCSMFQFILNKRVHYVDYLEFQQLKISKTSSVMTQKHPKNLFLLNGIASLLGWNVILVSLDYFDYLYSFDVYTWFPIPFFIASAIIAVIFRYMSQRLSFKMMLIIGILVMNTGLFCLLLLSYIPLQAYIRFEISLALCFFLGLGYILTQLCLFSLINYATSEVVSYFSIGTAISGLGITILRIIIVGIFGADQSSDIPIITFFSIAIIGNILFLILNLRFCSSQYFLTKIYPFTQFVEYQKLKKEQTGQGLIQNHRKEQSYIKKLFSASKHIFPMHLLIFANFAITLTVFPSLVVKRTFDSLDPTWLSLLYVLTYSVGDTVGRYIAQIRTTFNKLSVNYILFCRLYFIFSIGILSTTAVQSDNLMNNIPFAYLNLLMFSITNGFITNSCFVLAFQMIPARYKKQAGILCGLAVQFGIMIGTFISIPYSSLLQNMFENIY